MATPTTAWRALRRAAAPSQLLFNAALAALSFAVLVPVLWALSSSLKGPQELFEAVPSLWVREPTLANYEYMWTRMGNVPVYFRNSLAVSLGTVVLTVVTASLAGYAFARMEFRGRDALFLLIN